MTYKVGERVTVVDDKGNFFSTGTIINVNDFREPDKKYAVDVDSFLEDVMFLGEANLRKIQEEK